MAHFLFPLFCRDFRPIQELRRAIYREIDIMDAGSTYFDPPDVLPTAAFHIGAREKSTINRKSARSPKKDVHSWLCVFCESDHQGECFVSDITTRISIVKKKGLCFNCLSKTHQAVNCPSRFRCRLCKGKHHTSICESSHKTALSNVSSEKSQSGDSSHSVYNEGAAILHTSSMATHSNVLLKTAVSPICAGGRYADANILMDEVAQMSFISHASFTTRRL